MKKERTKIGLIALLMAFAMGPVRAQEWSFGPKAYLGLSRQLTVGEQVKIGSTLVSTVNYGDAIGSSFGGFARYDRPRWYALAEGTYGKYSLTNASVDNLSGGFPLYPSVVRTDARLQVGIKPLPWLRIHVGLANVFNQPKQTDYASFIQTYEDLVQKISH